MPLTPDFTQWELVIISMTFRITEELVMLPLKDTIFCPHFFLLNINCNLVTQTVSKVAQAAWCLRWYIPDTWIQRTGRLLYILKANSCRQLTHLKCLWKRVLSMIPLENVGSWGSEEHEGSLSAFFEFLLNYNNKPPKSDCPRSLGRTHFSYWRAT